MNTLSGARKSAADIHRSISKVVRKVLEREDIDPAVDLFDQGATSMAFIRIVAQANEMYDITIDAAALEEASIDSLAKQVRAQTNGGLLKGKDER
ncbi:acyl carrier protein [Streptomyces sp. NPDC050287]|uniref:acyl carrier protein n=1 Tax=Streptomyces sp. NPDC050287 TaxID=3365608 RepID=UPI003795F30E